MLFFFSPCCFCENKFKVSFLKASGRVCSELLRTFFSLQPCALPVALLLTSNLCWMVQEWTEQTVNVMIKE